MKSGNIGWITTGSIVRGAIHVRQEKPCQDAIYTDSQIYALACVADGHGSERCPFSDEGAQAAVDVIAQLLADLLEEDAFATLTANKEIWLPKQLESKWKTSVKAIHEKKERPTYEEGAFPYEQYGTTLLALVATENFVFALQIGDGDILVVDRDETARWLLPPHPSMNTVGEDTYSLCLEQSWQYMRTFIVPWDSTQGPLMFLLSTDGYANSFTNASGFLKAGVDIYKLWHENGLSYIEENIQDWLHQSTLEGSGDDIALALVLYEI